MSTASTPSPPTPPIQESVQDSAPASASPRFSSRRLALSLLVIGIIFTLVWTIHGKRIGDFRDAGIDKLPLPVEGDIPNFHRVHSYLYRGAFPSTKGVDELKQLGVRTILDLRLRDSSVEVEEIQSKLLGINYINLPTGDYISQDTQKRFLQLVEQASQDPTKSPLFVHCAHGSDRTGYLCALWRVKHDGWSIGEAVSEMLHYGYLVHMLEPYKPRN